MEDTVRSFPYIPLIWTDNRPIIICQPISATCSGPGSKIDLEKTVDWDRMPAAVAALSPGGYRGERVQASAEDIIRAARHLARHYEKADKSIPDTLGALI